MLQKFRDILDKAGAFDVQKCQIIRMNEVEAVQHSFNMAAAPALVSMVLGLIGLIWPSIFPIAFTAVQEFMQLVGIKLAFYVALFLGGLAPVFYLVKLQ